MSQAERFHWKESIFDRVEELLRRVGDLERRPAGSWARAEHSAGQSIGNGAAEVVEYDEELWDERGEYDEVTNYRFTAQVSGYYAVQAGLMFAATSAFAGAEYAALLLYKNDAQESILDRKDQLDAHAGTSEVRLGGSDLVHLEAGDYVEVWAYQNSGGARTLEADGDVNYLAVHRV
jgi:hypothetical protein